MYTKAEMPTLQQSVLQADGTRYLLLACRWGTYLMDRTFKVRRIQMRFICPDMKTRHHNTLLDGEMVGAAQHQYFHIRMCECLWWSSLVADLQ